MAETGLSGCTHNTQREELANGNNIGKDAGPHAQELTSLELHATLQPWLLAKAWQDTLFARQSQKIKLG